MSKKQSKDGVTLTINPPTSNYGIFNIVDIDVQPGVDSVTLDIDGLPRYNNFNVKLKNINKQFPDVRTLILDGHAYETEISNYMFPNVTRVEIPSNVKLIGESAFANCWNLSNLIFNEGLESIGPNAFRNCNLAEIVLPKSVRRLCDLTDMIL